MSTLATDVGLRLTCPSDLRRVFYGDDDGERHILAVALRLMAAVDAGVAKHRAELAFRYRQWRWVQLLNAVSSPCQASTMSRAYRRCPSPTG